MARRLALRLSFSLLVFPKVRHLIPTPVSFAAISLLRPLVVLISPFALTESRQILPVFLKKMYLCNGKVGRCHCISTRMPSSNPSWHFRIYARSRVAFQECGVLRLTTVAFLDFQRNARSRKKMNPAGGKKQHFGIVAADLTSALHMHSPSPQSVFYVFVHRFIQLWCTT